MTVNESPLSSPLTVTVVPETVSVIPATSCVSEPPLYVTERVVLDVIATVSLAVSIITVPDVNVAVVPSLLASIFKSEVFAASNSFPLIVETVFAVFDDTVTLMELV